MIGNTERQPRRRPVGRSDQQPPDVRVPQIKPFTVTTTERGGSGSLPAWLNPNSSPRSSN